MNIYVSKLSEIAFDSKYTLWYFELIERGLSRGAKRAAARKLVGYVEGHHILPKCFELGGEKDKENLVFLTAREHFVAHRLLVKMFDGIRKRKMLLALGSMARVGGTSSGRKILTARQFRIAREAFAEGQTGPRDLSEETREKLRVRSRQRRKLKDQPHLKWCNTCKRGLTFDQFYSSKNATDGKARRCRACYAEVRNSEDKIAVRDYKKNYHLKNIVEHKERMKQYNNENKEHLSKKTWERKNGITFLEYERIFTIQNGNCKLCEKPSRYRLLHHEQELFCRECKKDGKVSGNGRKRRKTFKSYIEASDYVRSLGISTQKEYQSWSATNRPEDIPGNPRDVYKNDGWINWGSFLGS